MNLRNIIPMFAAAVAWVTATPVYAINYDLASSNADLVAGNTTSTFFEVDGDGIITGSAAGLYTATLGGDADVGFWVKISFGLNPQPLLTSAFLKATNAYLWWDAADLAGFNAGTYDSITLWNSGDAGIKNDNGKFQGTSHAGLNGEPGTNVPDSTSTLALLGIGLAVLAMISRRRTT